MPGRFYTQIQLAMRNQVYNAVHDFTEKDRVASNYRKLWENKLRSDAHQFETEQQRAFNAALRIAIRDLSIWLLFIVAAVLVLIIAARWIG
jgi:hypothetical protein